MNQIFGNLPSQNALREGLKNYQTIVLTGPPHLGKASFARELLGETTYPSDFLIMEEGIDGVRDVVEFCRTTPLVGDHRVVLIDEADRLGEPAQDALLKITEEPNSSTKLIMVCHDVGYLQPALQSRIRNIIPWGRLSDSEMRSFAESTSSVIHEPILFLSSGHPGYYRIMVDNAGFYDLFQLITEVLEGRKNILMSPTPALVKDLKGASSIRDAVVHVLRLAARAAPKKAGPIYRLCDTLTHSVSASADIHWQRMSIHLSGVS